MFCLYDRKSRMCPRLAGFRNIYKDCILIVESDVHKYELRDVIHGLIDRSLIEVKIINTPIFQRLRRIHQLALANLVYPGAHHTRFEHSIGALHVAGKIAHRFKKVWKLSQTDINTLRLAALLHDIGHGPFSHVSEHLLEKYTPKNQLAGLDREKIHEQITKDIIFKNKDLSKLIKEEDREEIIRLLNKGQKHDFKSDIISGPLDADKLDYLLRDNYHTGVKYGLYDLDKIIESLRIIRFKGAGETYLGIDEEGIYALEQFVMAKYHMTTQIYFHKVRCITDSMIVRGIDLAIEEGLDEIKKLYSYDGTDEFIDRYCKYYDGNLIGLIIKKGGPLSKEIFERLFHRQLFKLIYSKRISDFQGAKLKDRVSTLNEADSRELEQAIGESLKINPQFVIVKIVDIKNPIGRPEGFSIDDSSILVKLLNREPEKISNISWSIFNFKGVSDNPPQLQVYAPYDLLTDMADSKKMAERKKLSDKVEKILYKLS